MVTLTSTLRVALGGARDFSGTRNSVVPCGDFARARRAALSTNCRIEQPIERLAERIGARHAVEPLERLVPADDAIVEADDQQPVVERLEDVLVERAQPIELRRLDVQLAIQPAVLDGGRRLRRRPPRAGPCLRWSAARRSRAGRARSTAFTRVVRDARHQVVDAGVAPDLDFFGGEAADRQRIVEPHDVARREPPADAGAAVQARRRGVEPDRAQRLELAGLVGRPAAPCDRRRTFP